MVKQLPLFDVHGRPVYGGTRELVGYTPPASSPPLTVDLGHMLAVLATLPPEMEIGRRNNCLHDPVATYLRWRYQPSDDNCVLVTESSIRVGAQRIDTPPPVRALLRQIDQLRYEDAKAGLTVRQVIRLLAREAV